MPRPTGPGSPERRDPAGANVPRALRGLTLGAGLVLGIVIVALLLTMQATSTPTFCGTCHIMKPYYRSWKQSAHNRIACVECHIRPGLGAELRKKYEALSMVVKYVTATYGTKPWAEVDDANCLRCHERRLLEGTVSFAGVMFDHRHHLTETRKGIRLRCTSCHSQLMIGSHIAVTPTTCALCHFQGQPANAGTGRCLLCHAIPNRVTTSAGTAFDHRDVATYGMACQSCHEAVVRGTGEVPRVRCFACHNQPERLAHFGDTGFLHDWHVSRHKIDCTNCHLEIDHGTPETATVTAAARDAGSCGSCHGSGHGAQQDLYRGVGGRGVPDMPGPMAAAGVTCQGCHNGEAVAAESGGAPTDASLGHPEPGSAPLEPVIQRADAVSCMICHGPSYAGILDSWRRAVDERVGALQRELEATVGAMGLEPPPTWQDARHNFLLVAQGRGAHNVNFAQALLDKAWEQMNEARRAKGLGPLERPWRVVGGSSGRCVLCHSGIEAQHGTWKGKAFDHGPHLLKAGLECAACHRTHAERAPGEIVRFGVAGCIPCHHQQAVAASGACLQCHRDVTTRTVRSFRGDFSHQAHLAMELRCGDCHNPAAGQLRPTRAACAQCHQD